ncbi:rod shape-determining protein [Kribbella sp. NPDC048915]|uniref:rod shape-determining protein n=1 Tax=Kribbella sp. NPDC048915 TaxID=3155148 RepID=UPI0033E8B032
MRGRVQDVEGAASLVAEVVSGMPSTELIAVATKPVLCADVDRANLRTALTAAGATRVVMIDAVKAAALGAAADLTEPLLVVDVGAELIEVALLSDGAVVEARSALLGLDDGLPTAVLVDETADAIVELLRGDRGPQVADALDRPILLTGGGGLDSDIAAALGERLAAIVRSAPAPLTAAVRGAATVLQSAYRHPGIHSGLHLGVSRRSWR